MLKKGSEHRAGWLLLNLRVSKMPKTGITRQRTRKLSLSGTVLAIRELILLKDYRNWLLLRHRALLPY